TNQITVDNANGFTTGDQITVVDYVGSAPDIGAYEYQQVGVEEKYQGYIYPNQCLVYMGVDYITFSNISSGNNIEIFDITGKLIHNSGNITSDTYKWNVDNISIGIYFYRITGSNKAKGKIMIIR
ncbi:hypothetical protein DRP43_03560, partial [candidate division TA06 bacterium]